MKVHLFLRKNLEFLQWSQVEILRQSCQLRCMVPLFTKFIVTKAIPKTMRTTQEKIQSQLLAAMNKVIY